MATKCFAPFAAQLFRATRLDACGKPVVGTKTTLVSDGLISVALAPQYETGNEVIVKNARGDIKVAEKVPDVLKWVEATITLTGVDPDLFEMSTGQQLVTNQAADAVGLRIGETIPASTGIALETWTAMGGDTGACSGGAAAYGYFLVPYLVQFTIGDITLNDGAMDCVLKGHTRRNSQWVKGPTSYTPVNSGTGNAAGQLMTSIGLKDHVHFEQTTIAPPTPACGAVALSAA